ncbi:MAG: YjbH domain-containing protein, partial [Deltaproteobacteria bacterium]|nr:YjbH domain-containing protein [Deltaproteobacteria bacterium]
GVSQIKPYRYYYMGVSPLKGLEIDGRITEVIDIPALTSGYGNYKDKAIDLKYQLIRESKYLPAFAIGIMDPHGTRVYSSQYLAASKQIYPFDFTIGFGNGRFGKNPLPSQGEGFGIEMFQESKTWLKDSQFFGGIQFAPSDKYAFVLEYSPIKYHKQTSDPARSKYFNEPVPSPYNIGFRWKPYKWIEADFSYQRGNQIGVNLSFNFDIGKPIVPIYDHLYKEKLRDKDSSIGARITRVLYYSGFSGISVAVKDNDLWIEAQNDKYYYTTRAIDVITKVLAEISPQDVNNVHIIIKENGISKMEFTTTMADIIDLHSEKLTAGEFRYLSKVNTDISKALDEPQEHTKTFEYGIKPSFQTFLNDPSGFFKYRLGIAGWLTYHPWDGASIVTGLEGYPINNVTSRNKPLSIPVRTDIVDYKKENVALGKLMFDQIYKMPNELYGRVSAGYLEVQYAGLDGEVAKPFFDGRVVLGVGGSIVKKRMPDNLFKLKEDDARDFYHTTFFNTRLNFPEKEISVDFKTGRFLAGDVGTKLTVSKFINGVILSAWYSFTDTSVFSDDFNRGYHDKGIGVIIPLRLFKGSDSRTSFHYGLSPWTRDVAQDIEHHNDLFDFIGRDTNIFLDKDSKLLFK